MDNEIYHWGIKIGEKSKKHKYYERINLGSESKPKYRYFYSSDEYKAYLESLKKKASGYINKATARINDTAKKASNAVKSYTKKGSEYITSTYKNVSNDVKNNKQIQKAVKTVSDTANKAAKTVNKIANSKEVKNAVKTISENTNKAVKAVNKAANSKPVKDALNFAKKITKVISDSANKTLKEVNNYVSKNVSKISKEISKNLNKSMSYVESKINSRTGSTSQKGAQFINSVLSSAKKSNEKKISGFKGYNAKDILHNAIEDVKDWADKTAKDFKKLTTVAKHILSDKEFRDLLMSGNVSKAYKDFIKDNPELKDVFRPITSKGSDRAERNKVNPFYDDNSDYETNCYSCSLSYDLRMKGFDVKAIPDVWGGMSKEQIESLYKDGKFSTVDFSDSIGEDGKDGNYELDVYKMHQKLDEQILAQSNGEDSTGFVTVWWDGGGGHIFNYVVEDGKVKYIDTQPSSYFTDNQSHEADIDEYLYRSRAWNYPDDTINIMRTDNLKVNEQTVKYATLPDYVGNYDDADIAAYESKIWLSCNLIDDALKAYEQGTLKNNKFSVFGDDEFYIDFNEYSSPAEIVSEIKEFIGDNLEEMREEYGADDFCDFIDDFKYINKYM